VEIGAARCWIKSKFDDISKACGGCLKVYFQSQTIQGEERWLFGGKTLAKAAQKNEWCLKAVLNNDMIGNIPSINGVVNNTTARILLKGLATPKPMHKLALAGIQMAK
jgi:hypothetical protein